MNDVAGANDREVFRYPPTQGPRRLHRANGRGVVDGEDRGELRSLGQQAGGRVVAVALDEAGLHDPAVLHVDAGLAHAASVPAMAAARVNQARSGQVADVAMSETEQV